MPDISFYSSCFIGRFVNLSVILTTRYDAVTDNNFNCHSGVIVIAPKPPDVTLKLHVSDNILYGVFINADAASRVYVVPRRFRIYYITRECFFTVFCKY